MLNRLKYDPLLDLYQDMNGNYFQHFQRKFNKTGDTYSVEDTYIKNKFIPVSQTTINVLKNELGVN